MKTHGVPNESAAGPGDPLTGANVLVGVTGGIAAYKAATIVSRLAQRGAIVTVAMTESATRFIRPLTLQALSGRPVYTSPWEHVESHDPQHIATASGSDIAVVAPCTMDCMARLATGRADDIVSLLLSAVDRSRTPVVLCPAMNSVMWAQPATRRNARLLEADGFDLLGPAEGWQACRHVGPGRMVEPDAVIELLEERCRSRRVARAEEFARSEREASMPPGARPSPTQPKASGPPTAPIGTG